MTFEDLVAEDGQSLLRLAYLLTGDRHLAEDLTQIALADAYRQWRRVQVARNPQAYVRRMLVNAHLSWRRRLCTTERPMLRVDDAAGTVADPADAVIAREQMQILLGGLAPRARTVLVLRYYLDLDDTAIAETMAISASAVRATASRALANLRGSLPHDAVKETR